MKVKFGIFDEHTGGTGRYGGGVNEATIAKWRKKIGDKVEKGEIVVDIETDKAVAEIDAPVSGIIVSQEFAEHDAWKEYNSEETPYGVLHNPPLGYIETEEVIEKKVENNDHKKEKPAEPKKQETEKPIRAVPLARTLARAHGVDLSDVPGGGEGGIIKLQDVEAFIKVKNSEKEKESERKPEIKNDRNIVPATTLRKTVARLLTKSWQEIPHAGDAKVIEIAGLVKFVESNKGLWQKITGTKLRYDYFFMFFAARHLLLEQFKICNAYWDKDTESIVYLNHVNLGFAVQSPAGLVVPVIHEAEKLSFVELAKSCEEKIKKAAEHKLNLNDYRGLSFTVNNVGAAGGENPDPIIPYTADFDGKERSTGMLIAMASIDRLAILPALKVAVRFDHRLLDGAQALRFMLAMKEFFESKKNPKDWEEIL